MTTVLAPSEAQWRRLSPRMLLVHPVIEVGKALPAIVGVLLAGHSSHGDTGQYWGLAIAGVVAFFAVLRYFTTRYRITRDQIQLRRGLLRRKTLAAPLDRVRTVDVTAHLLHRIVGTARVVVGTGTSDRKGRDRLVLDGLSAGTAAALRSELLHREPVTVDLTKQQPVEFELARLDPAWLRYAPFTLTGAVTGLAILGVGWRVVSEGHIDVQRSGPYRAVADHVDRWPVALDIIGALAAVVACIALLSTAGYLLSFWRFRLTRHSGGTLHVSRGLVTSRATSIERRRLRGAELSEPLLLRWVGGARCIAIATGLRVGRGAERGGEILLPPAPRRVAVEVAGAVLESGVPLSAPLLAHPTAARRRRLLRALAGAAAILGCDVLVVWLAGWTWWLIAPALAVVVLAVPLGVDRYRSLGHTLADGYLVTRFGSLVRRHCAVQVDGVIGWTVRNTYFQRRVGLATLKATTAAGRQGYPIGDVTAAEAVRFADAALPGLLTDFLDVRTTLR